VPRDPRKGEVGPLPFDRETVAVAHTADLDTDADLSPRWVGYVALDEFERAAADAARAPVNRGWAHWMGHLHPRARLNR
jgi:hypothetical protein